jgi:hypothetical protein
MAMWSTASALWSRRSTGVPGPDYQGLKRFCNAGRPPLVQARPTVDGLTAAARMKRVVATLSASEWTAVGRAVRAGSEGAVWPSRTKRVVAASIARCIHVPT